ncbi:MAG: hypothetical protein C5B51_23905 [Terriglobia bacterium]|nr:MAG: hypothetical protein C5B51_23905 [Terriglobia bacterium]
MPDLGPPLVALTVASAVTLLEMITSSYPRTFYFVRRCGALYAYVVVYGMVALGVVAGFDTVVHSGNLRLEGFGVSNPWFRAVALGVSVKALLHIRLFTVGIGDRNMPFGTETIVQMFEPWLMEQVQFYEFNSVREFLRPWEQQHSNIADIRSIVLANLPYSFAGAERVAFEVSLKRRDRTAIECMEMYLRRFGKANFERAFSRSAQI